MTLIYMQVNKVIDLIFEKGNVNDFKHTLYRSFSV